MLWLPLERKPLFLKASKYVFTLRPFATSLAKSQTAAEWHQYFWSLKIVVHSAAVCDYFFKSQMAAERVRLFQCSEIVAFRCGGASIIFVDNLFFNRSPWGRRLRVSVSPCLPRSICRPPRASPASPWTCSKVVDLCLPYLLLSLKLGMCALAHVPEEDRGTRAGGNLTFRSSM